MLLSGDQKSHNVLANTQRLLQRADPRRLGRKFKQDVMAFALTTDRVRELALTPGIDAIDLTTLSADAIGNSINMGGRQGGSAFSTENDDQLIIAHQQPFLWVCPAQKSWPRRKGKSQE